MQFVGYAFVSCLSVARKRYNTEFLREENRFFHKDKLEVTILMSVIQNM